MSEQTKVQFYLDPACPWCWRTNLWIREVAQVRPIEIEGDFLSLSMVNKQASSLEGLNSPSEAALRTLVLARRKDGNDAVARLYLALGEARHSRQEKLEDQAVVKAALVKAELDENLLQQAL